MTIPCLSSDTNSSKHERESMTRKIKGSDVHAPSVQIVTSQNAEDGSRTSFLVYPLSGPFHIAVVFGRIKKTARKSTGGKLSRPPPASTTAIQIVKADGGVPHRSNGIGRVKKTARKSTCGERPRPLCIIPYPEPPPNKDAN